MNNPALIVDKVSFAYKNEKKVLSNVCFSLNQGEILTILGPNGSGKTTLLNCLLNNHTSYSGDILLFGRNLKQISPKEYAADVAYVPQFGLLSFDYSVEDFVLMGINPHKTFFQQPTSADYELVHHFLDTLGLSHLAKQAMNEISGGERQLAYIARALTQQPKIIIMDEPTSALDYSNQYKVIQILKKLNHDGYTVILTSHNPEYAYMLGGFVGMIFRNNSFQFGRVAELMTNDKLTALYGTQIGVVYLSEYSTYVCVRAGIKPGGVE